MKRIALKVLIAVLWLLCSAFVFCALTVSGSGFLDRANVVRIVFFGLALLTGLGAMLLMQKARR